MPELTLRRALFLIVVLVPTLTYVARAAKPPKRPVPQNRVPGPCLTTVVINSVTYDPSAQDIDISYTERCSSGTDGNGCPIAITELLWWFNENTLDWQEVNSACTNSSMACGGSGTIYTTTSFNLSQWKPGNAFMFSIGFYKGSCANQSGLLTSETIEFSN